MLKYLLIFVPVAFVLEYTHAAPTLIFLAAALGIVPLAGWLGQATEELAAHLGAAIGGLLNATFGNATELIIAFFALLAGQVEVVKASIIGSIIGNVLLVLGLAALVGGRRYARLGYNVENIKVLSSMMVITMIGFVVPAVFDFNERIRLSESEAHALTLDADLSLGVAIVLIILYAGNLIFSLITHKDLLSSSDEEAGEHAAGWSIPRAVGILLVATVLIAFMSEFLVGALEGFTSALGLSATFVGLIVIPIIGNAAEHASAVTFAMRNKMDLAVVIAIGSALQIALLVAPLLVLLSWAIGQPMDLVLRGPLELTALIGSVLIANSVARDGETHWYEGLMLLGVYIILAIAFFFTPGGAA
ncbi:MAG: calcium/proton exchanger [Caldilineaceae bacterium]